MSSVAPIHSASGNSMTIRACVFMVGVLHILRGILYVFDPYYHVICFIWFFVPTCWLFYCSRNDVDYKKAKQYHGIGAIVSYAFCAQWIGLYILDTYIKPDESTKEVDYIMQIHIAIIWAILCSGGLYIMKIADQTERANAVIRSRPHSE